MERLKQNKMSRVFTVCLMIMAMLLSSVASMNVFAANKASITVKNVEPGATVTAYRLVQKGTDGDWEPAQGVGDKFDKVKKGDADTIIELSKKLPSLRR